MKKISIFWAGSFIATILCLFVTLLILPLSEKWLKDTYLIKEYLLTTKEKKKIIIIGGSSSLFGSNGDIIEKNLKTHNFEVINLATHAGLPINFHIDKAIKFANNGDIVIMPLEFSYYTRHKPDYHDRWYIQNMLSWGNGYNKFITKIDIIIGSLPLDFQEIPKAIWNTLSLQDTNPLQTWLAKAQTNQIYNFKNLNKWGDFCIRQKTHLSKTSNTSYLPPNIQLSSFFLSEIQRAMMYFEQNNIKFFLTYPPTMQNSKFDLSKKEDADKILHLEKQLKMYQIPIIGNAINFHYPDHFFLDTFYHLNCDGSIERSKILARIINHLILKTNESKD